MKVFKTTRDRPVSPEVARECDVGTLVRQTPHPCYLDANSFESGKKIADEGATWRTFPLIMFFDFEQSQFQACLCVRKRFQPNNWLAARGRFCFT